MKTILKIPVLAFALALATTVCAQPTALEKAFATLKEIDGRLAKNPNDTLSPAKRLDLDLAIGEFEKTGNSYEQALSLFYRANTAENLRWPRQMFTDLEKSRKILETAQSDSAYLVLGHIWNAYSSYYGNFRFDFYKASEALDKSKTYYKRAKHRIGQVQSTGNFAFTLSQFGQGGLALARTKECEAEFETLTVEEKEVADISRSYINFLYGNAHFILSDSLLFASEPAAALRHLDSALTYLNRIFPGRDRVDMPRIANTWFLKGLSYFRLNTSSAADSALVYIEKATNIFAFAGASAQSPFGLGQAIMGGIRLRQDSIELGKSLISSGMKNLGFQPFAFYSILKPGKPRTVLQIQALIVKVSAMDILYQKNPEQGLLKQIVFDTETIASLMEDIKDNYKDRQSVERLSDRVSAIYAFGVAAAAALANEGGPAAEEWKERGLRLSELGKGFALRFNLIKRLLPDESAKQFTNERAEKDFYTLASIRQTLLNDSTAAIEYSIGLSKTTAIIITKHDIQMVSLPPIDQWKKDLEVADKLLREYKSFYTQSANLYKILLEPLVKRLPSGIRHLILIPDGILWRLNFDALVTGKDENGQFRYLIESYALSQSYSLQITALMAEHSSKTSDNSIGIYLGSFKHSAENKSEAGNGFTALPQYRELAIRLASEWAVVRIDSLREAFIKNFGNQDLAFVGTHGYASSTLPSEEYYLAFAEDTSEWLYVRDIYKLKADKSQMIFLAACLTAFGGSTIKGEGLPSLARAFHYAGVPALITASTIIQEIDSAELAESYFNEIKNGHLTAAGALQRAKIAFLRNPEYNVRPHPKLWAPLICLGYGNWKL